MERKSYRREYLGASRNFSWTEEALNEFERKYKMGQINIVNQGKQRKCKLIPYNKKIDLNKADDEH